MSKKYNGLNSIKIDLAKSGICAACGRRFTDPFCTHATPEQIQFTIDLDAKWDADIKSRNEKYHPVSEIESTVAECERIQSWLSDNWEFIPEIPFGEGV